jgi:HNH endonuclease
MKKIPMTGKLGQGEFALVDDEDFEELSKYKWHLTSGYATRYKRGKTRRSSRVYWMHRIINKTPENFDTDHINGNRLDNRRANLRTVNRSENAFNRPKFSRSTSGYVGIYPIIRAGSKLRWHAYIRKNWKHIFLGTFDRIEDAVKARKEAEVKYYGVAMATSNIKTKVESNNL